MFNYQFLQISDFGYNEIMSQLEKIKHIEFLSMDKAIVTEQRDSRTVSDGGNELIQKLGSRAMITVNGPFMYNPGPFQRWFMGAVDTQEIMDAVEEAQNDDDIETVLFVWNSPGGSTQKLHVLSSMIFELSKLKTTASLNVGSMNSAAYHVGSQARKIFVDDKMNSTGSIGTKAIIKDSSEHFKQIGVEVIPITTGPLKEMFEPGVKVSEEVKTYVRDRVNEEQGLFNDSVQRARQHVDVSDGAEARSGADFTFSDAERLGLVDGLKSLGEAFTELEQMKEFDNRVNAL